MGASKSTTQNTAIVIVTGATGNTGGSVVRELAKSGKCAEIRAMVRSKEHANAKALAALPGVTLVVADYEKPDTLKEAVKGCNRAYLVSTSGEEAQASREIAFLTACKEANIYCVRCSTATPLISPETACVYAKCHSQVEKWIADEKARVTDLNPGWFMENLVGSAQEAKMAGTISYPIAGGKKHGFSSNVDIARAATALIISSDEELKKHEGKKYEIHAPVQFSWDDLLAAISKEVGYTIKLKTITSEAFIAMLQSFGMTPLLATSFDLTFQTMDGDAKGYATPVEVTSPELLAVMKAHNLAPEETAESFAKRNRDAFVKPAEAPEADTKAK